MPLGTPARNKKRRKARAVEVANTFEEDAMAVCMSFISISLPSRTTAFFKHPLYMTESCPQSLWVTLGQPFLLRPISARQKKSERTKEKDKENYRLGQARPALFTLRAPDDLLALSSPTLALAILANALHPTRVASKNSSTASVASSFHSSAPAPSGAPTGSPFALLTIARGSGGPRLGTP